MVSDERELDALKAEWTALEQEAACTSIFTTWDWQRLWWKHYGMAHSLRIVVVRDGARVVGIAPMYHRPQRLLGIWPSTEVIPMGVGGDTAPDDLDPLLLAGCEEPAALAIARCLVDRGDWSALSVTDARPHGEWLRALRTVLAERSIPCWSTGEVRITYGDLPASWEHFLAGLHSDRRQRVRRYWRKFEQQPGARFVQITEASDIDPAFDRLAHLHHLRWQGRSAEHGFSTPAYLGFHRDLMHALHARGRLRLYALERDGQAIAMLYGMRLDGTFYYFQSGFDPTFAHFHPGSVLLARIVRAAIDEGCDRFDMLRGDYDHKRRLFHQVRVNAGIRAFRPPLLAAAYRARKGFAKLLASPNAPSACRDRDAETS